LSCPTLCEGRLRYARGYHQLKGSVPEPGGSQNTDQKPKLLVCTCNSFYESGQQVGQRKLQKNRAEWSHRPERSGREPLHPSQTPRKGYPTEKGRRNLCVVRRSASPERPRRLSAATALRRLTAGGSPSIFTTCGPTIWFAHGHAINADQAVSRRARAF